MPTILSPEASAGRAELYRLFDLLQAAEQNVRLLRDAGEPYSPELAQECQSAYRLFTKAYDVWHRLMPGRPDYNATPPPAPASCSPLGVGVQ